MANYPDLSIYHLSAEQRESLKDADDEIIIKTIIENSNVICGDALLHWSFEGQNCDCDGWDGVDSRCACGNRRVDWELSDDKTYIYAVAY